MDHSWFGRLLGEALARRHLPVVGCPRQNRLAQSHDSDWRWLRGQALAAVVGTRHTITTPQFYFDIWTVQDPTGDLYLIEFRGGKRKPWWHEDLTLTLAFVLVHSSLPVVGAVLVQELDNSLYIDYIGAPSLDEAQPLVSEALARWHNHSRIPKNGSRALASCRYCTVASSCDQLDLERNETQDWPQNQPTSLSSLT
jgi:hypothetical protein